MQICEFYYICELVIEIPLKYKNNLCYAGCKNVYPVKSCCVFSLIEAGASVLGGITFS